MAPAGVGRDLSAERREERSKRRARELVARMGGGREREVELARPRWEGRTARLTEL